MRTDVKLNKLEMYLVVAVCGAIMLEVAFLLSRPLAADDFGMSTPAAQVWSKAPEAAESPPAVLEPALRTLDGVVSHG